MKNSDKMIEEGKDYKQILKQSQKLDLYIVLKMRKQKRIN